MTLIEKSAVYTETVFLFMLLQSMLCREFSVTFIAVMDLASMRCFHMSFKPFLVREHFITFLTSVELAGVR